MTPAIRIGLASTLLVFSCSTAQAMSAADCLRSLSLSDMLSKAGSATSAHPEFLGAGGMNTTTETSRAILSHAYFEATPSVAPEDIQSFVRRFCELLRQGLTNNCGPAVPLYSLTINARSNESIMLVDSECSFDFSSDSATAFLEALFVKQQNRSVRVVVLATTWEPRTAK